jgi:F0F1-type ATP synthase assembly protein I
MSNSKAETDKTDSQSTKDTQKTTEELRTKAFQIALEMVAVFGGPAIVALLVGRWLESIDGWPHWITYVLLAVAFISSWGIVMYRVRSLARELEASKNSREDNGAGSATDQSTTREEADSHSEQ